MIIKVVRWAIEVSEKGDQELRIWIRDPFDDKEFLKDSLTVKGLQVHIEPG